MPKNTKEKFLLELSKPEVVNLINDLNNYKIIVRPKGDEYEILSKNSVWDCFLWGTIKIDHINENKTNIELDLNAPSPNNLEMNSSLSRAFNKLYKIKVDNEVFNKIIKLSKYNF